MSENYRKCDVCQTLTPENNLISLVKQEPDGVLVIAVSREKSKINYEYKEVCGKSCLLRLIDDDLNEYLGLVNVFKSKNGGSHERIQVG